MIKATFVMEQQVGHQTFYENLREFIDIDPNIEPYWVEVTYVDENRPFWTRIPLLPEHIQDSLIGRHQVREGLKESYEVAFFNTQVPAALASNLTKKRPYILCTDITPIQYDEMGAHYGHAPDRNPLMRKYKHHVNKDLFQNATHTITWSHWVKNSLLTDYGVNPEKITVIPPGVDTNLWQPIRLNKNNEKFKILFVGGDFYRKGGDTLLDAFNLLPTGQAELNIVTRSPIKATETIHVFNNLTPNSPKLINLYQTSDVVVFPTKAEAFGIAAIEASAAGLPIIATATGGLTDIVVDGKTGFLIELEDAETLAQRLQGLIERPELKETMGRAGRERVEKYFDARKNAQRISTLLQENAKISA